MLINGIQANQIDAMDRGLAYGDGLFSTMKVQYGEVQLWTLHLQRLQLGAKRLFFPEIDWLQLQAEVFSVALDVADKKECVLKVILSRGQGGRGYSTQGCENVQRIISTADSPHFYSQWQQQGIDIVLCELQLATNKQLAGLKTLNRLEQVLIKKELEKKGAVEGIVCDNNGYIIEACTANLFVFIDDCWQTPLLDGSGVAGVQRRHVMQQAALAGINIVEKKIPLNKLKQAQAICLTNALMGVVPVKQYQQHQFDEKSLQHCKVLQSLAEKGKE